MQNTCGNDGGLPVRNLCVTLCNLQPLWQYRVERRAGMVHGSCHDLFDDRRFLLTAKYGGSCKTAIWLGEAAFVAVTLIGLLQKLGYDPLGLLKGYVVGDWEFTHMLTTLGNSNWLSGYYSVMFPFSMALFHRAVEAGKKVQHCWQERVICWP